MALFLLFLTVLSLSHGLLLPSPQCISLLANTFMSTEEKYHWRSVYEELIQMDSVKEDLFAVFGYQLTAVMEERCVKETMKENVFEKYPTRDNGKEVSVSKTEDVGEEKWNGRKKEEESSDCLVLSDLYEMAGGGISWGVDSSWNDVKKNCCSCPEIKCNDEGRVNEVDIRGLRGELPSNLWDLSELEVLVLVGEGEGNTSYPEGSVEELFDYFEGRNAIGTFLVGRIPSGEEIIMKELRTLVMYGSFDEGCIPSVGVIERSRSMMIVGKFVCDLSSVDLPSEVERLQLVGSFVGNIPRIPRSAIFIDIEGHFMGELSKEFVNLNSSMRKLILSGNLEGIITSSISQFSQLTLLDLVGYFEGTIPLSISKLTQLTFFKLIGSFEGIVPPSISELSQLTLLDLVGNFEGVIPSSISQLSHLTYLKLVGNFEEAIPSFISELTQLTFLELVGSFEGIIPSSISELSQLTVLALGGGFEGTIPSSISELTQLTDLELVGNFKGAIPSFISELSHLTFLALIGNFKGTIPPSISELSRLTLLQLVGNFEGTIPSSISELSHLTFLQLAGNFRGAIPPSISELSHLTFLQLIGNFEGTIPLGHQFGKSLRTIRIVGDFTDELGADAFNMPFVKKMSICCGLNISEFSTLRNMTKLVDLDLLGNNIGYVGSFISELKSLEVLILDHCNISALPSLSSLHNLRYVSASHNNLSKIGDLFFIPTMEQIDLSYNNLGGRFTAFSRSNRYTWNSLLSVSLSYNELTELVLMESGSLPILRDLDISHNRLTGNLSSLMPLVFPSLRSANFFNNSLSGHIPSTFSRFTHMETLDLRMNENLRRGEVENFGETTETYRNDKSSSWTCNDMEIKTAVGYYSLEVDDTFQEYETCACDVGFYGNPPNCRNCDEVSPLATCPGEGRVYAPQGYWATPPMNEKRRTYPSHVIACGGAGTSETRCRPEPKNYGKTCSSGYSGRMCSGCESGYFSIGNGCARCMKGTEGRVFMICGVVFILVFFICISFSGTISESGSVKILVVFIQTLFFIWNTRSIKGSEYVSFATGFFGHLQLPGPSCYVDGWTYETTYAVTLLFPMVILISICMIFILWNLVLKIRKRETTKWRRRSGTAIAFVIYFSYVAFSSEVVRPIPCGEDPGLKERFMTNNPDEKCNRILQIVSGILLLSVVLTVPSGLLFRYIVKGRPSQSSPLNTLSLQYHRSRWMWELVITGRRILLIVSFMGISSKTVYQSFLVCVVLGGSLILQIRYLPFRSRLENIFESLSLLLVMINFGVVLQYGSPETKQDSSLSFILISVDVLFSLVCIIYIFRSFILRVVDTLTGKRKTTIDNGLRTSLVPM